MLKLCSGRRRIKLNVWLAHLGGKIYEDNQILTGSLELEDLRRLIVDDQWEKSRFTHA
jgi:hypothetical protein